MPNYSNEGKSGGRGQPPFFRFSPALFTFYDLSKLPLFLLQANPYNLGPPLQVHPLNL